MMHLSMSTRVVLCIFLFVALSPVASNGQAITADHNACAQFDLIPDSIITLIHTSSTMFYGHTSHGSQIVTGMDMLGTEDPSLAYNAGAGTFQLWEYSDDLGHNGDTSWASITRQRLDDPAVDENIVLWSWCGGCSDNTPEGISIYLNKYAELEAQYPDVTFIYMTGHLDGGGVDGTLYTSNNQIREWCQTNNKILFDFADIESYDPDGNYYPDESDYCYWCADWCAAHSCPSCGSCAHSHCFNCYQKGKAFWWLLSQIYEWEPSPECCDLRADINHDGTGPDITDLVYLVTYMFNGGDAPACFGEADINGDGTGPDITDLVYLVTFMFNGGPAPVACPVE